MKRYILSICSVVLASFVLYSTPAPAQETQEAPKALAVPAVSTTQETGQAKELSIYGEVQAVNAAANSISAQYYDYDSDEEKTIELVVNKDTKIDGAAGLGDIKKGDWVDATYEVSDGKNVLKMVTVEKEEMLPGDTATEPQPANLMNEEE